jgi:heptaprenyl diphosphate synthase
MTLAKKIPDTSPIGTSIVGGCAHNIGQIIVAIFVVKNFSIALYLPLLLISGALTGAVIGACSIPVIKRLSKVGF